MYVRHPDSYLPPLNNLSETDGENNTQRYNTTCQADAESERRKLSGKKIIIFYVFQLLINPPVMRLSLKNHLLKHTSHSWENYKNKCRDYRNSIKEFKF